MYVYHNNQNLIKYFKHFIPVKGINTIHSTMYLYCTIILGLNSL